MTGPRAFAIGILAGWMLAVGLLTAAGAVTGNITAWTYATGATCSLVIGWGLPAIWFQTWRAVPGPRPRFPVGESPETLAAPLSPGENGAAGGPRDRP